jgi:hypothetical protein
MFGFDIDVWDLATWGGLAVIALAIASALLSLDDAPSRSGIAERRRS